MEFDLDNVRAICTRYAAMQHPVEVYCLLRFLRPRNVRLIVELGVHRGGMAATLLTFLPDAQLIGIEMLPVGAPHPPIESVPLPPDAPTLSQTAAEFGRRMAIVQGSSYDPASFDRVVDIGNVPHEGRAIDFVFIDASHDYASVRRDYELWSSHARVVGFHDLYSDDIQKYWHEISERKTFGLWKEHDGLGIGVLC